MTEYEIEMIKVATSIRNELSNIATRLDEIETKLNDMYEEQCHPGEQRLEDERRRTKSLARETAQ